MKKAMEKRFKSKITTGMLLLLLLMVLSIIFATGVFAANEEAAKTATEEIGVAYRGHVQNQGNMPKPEGSLVAGPSELGTRGQGLRVEGFWIELTGNVPEGANIVYEVHVQNEGWMTPVKNGTFAGTTGESQRVESIKIRLENLPGYDVYYRGHVENVGDVPQIDGEWGWKKNGEELGTTGSSQRLEELQVKIVKQAEVTYDKAGTYGPKTGVEVIENDVSINTPDVVLQNLHIKGNLTIGEGVGEGDVTLNNITVEGETYVRGGGKNSIHINGGDYNKITIQQTSSGQVRIVATDSDGLEVVVSEDAKGEDIILEGAFENVQIDAPDVKISTQGDTTIKDMVIGESSTGSEITLDKDTTVNKIDLNASVDMKGEGTIEKANVNSDDVTFEQKPVEETVAPEVKVPPVVTPPTPPPSSPSGPSAEELRVAEFNNAKNNVAMLELLWENALSLDLTGFDQLDYMEECIVVQTLLDKDWFANRAAIQTAVTEGIKLAQDDAQANAYMKALFSYTPELSVEDNICTVTYPDKLTTAQQSLLNGLYADLVILIDTPLSDGEVFELTVGDTTKQITNRDFAGKEILLSKLLGRKLVDGDLVQNQKSTFTISVKDVNTKVERYVTVCPCTSKNGDEYINNFTNAYALELSPFWLEAYADALTIDYQNSEFLFNYANNFTDVQKEGLAGYYGDMIIGLDRKLEPGESIKISAMGQVATLSSSTDMDNAENTEVRLSKLMGVMSNLAVDQKGDQKVSLSDINLTRSNVIFVNPVLVKTNEATIYAGNGCGAALYPTWLDEYRDSVSLTAENSQLVVNYKGEVSSAVLTGLEDYRADVMIYLDRELEEEETITVSAFNKTETLTKGKMDGTQIKLSDLMKITQEAAGKSGDDVIEFSVDGLNRNIHVYANPILVNIDTDGIEYLNYGTNLSLYQPSFKAYSDSIELSSEDNKILVNYIGVLSPTVQAKLMGYYADTLIYLDRPLEAGEIVTVKASNLDEPIVISNTSLAEDSEKQSYRLAKLLGIERDEANLAVNQTGSFEIAVDENTLKKQMYISATAILVKDDQIEYLDHYTGMSNNPPSFEAYDKSVEIHTDTNQGFTVTHKGGLSPVDVKNLDGLYGDTLISFERPLTVGESIKVHAYEKEAVITSSNFKEWGDNRIGLTELLKISPNCAPLATHQGDAIKISFSDVNLKSSNSIAAWNGLIKSDGTCVYRGNSGFGIFIYPWFMDAYKNNISLVSGENKISVTYLNKLLANEKLALADYYSDTLIYLSRPLVDDETVTINAFDKSVTVNRSTLTENNGTQIRLSDLLKPLDEEIQLAAKQTGFDITVTDKSLKSDLMVTAEAILRKGKVIEYLHQSTGLELKAQTIQDTEDPCITNAIIELSDGINVPLDLTSGILTLERYAITKKIEFDMSEPVVLSANPVLQIRLDNQLVEYGKIEYADGNHQKLIVTPNSEALGTAGRLGYFAFTLPDGTITDMSGNKIKGINGDYLDQILLKVVDTAAPTIEGITATVDDVEIEAIKNNDVFEMNVLQNSVTSEIRVKMSEPVTVKDGATILIPGTSTSYGSIEVDSNDSSIIVIKPASPGIGTAGQLGLTTFTIPENLVCDLVDNDSSNIQSPSSIAFKGGGLGNAKTSFNLNVLAPDTEKPTMTALTAILNNNSDTTVNATGNPLKLVLDKDSLTTQIVVELNENVTLKNGATSDEGAVVTMSGEGIQEGTIYGKIYRETSIENQLIIVPNGSNGIAGLTGTFTFKVAADTIFDSSNNGNAETSFTLEVVDPVV